MASRKPYECCRCRDNGFPNTMVYLAGKDEQGKTIQLEENGTGHQHKYKGKEGQGQQSSTQSTTSPVETKTLTIGSTAAAAHRIHRIVQNLFVQY